MTTASPNELCQDAADILSRIKKRLGSQFTELLGPEIVSDTEIFLEEVNRFNEVSELWAGIARNQYRIGGGDYHV